MHLRNFRVCNFTVSSDKVSRPLRLVFMSDLHAVTFEKPGDIAAGSDPDGPNGKIVRAVEAIHPDAVLVGGDMIVSREARLEEDGWMDVSLDLMRRLASKFPVYLADGNHEAQLANPDLDGRFLPAYNRYNAAAETAGVIHLHNRCAGAGTAGAVRSGPDIAGSFYSGQQSVHCMAGQQLAAANVRLYGLDLDCITYEKWMNYPLTVPEIEEKTGPADASYFNILMAHNPKYFPVYAAWGADLVLSGHIHGGILRFPNGQGLLSPDWKLFPPYTAGEYHDGNAVMILTAGIGTHTVPIRINNPPDICSIEIKPQSSGTLQNVRNSGTP